MTRLRKYGNAPFELAVIHGGPGGAGGMEPVAENLSKHFGVLEPIQNAKSVQGQIDELKEALESETDKPIVLAGHSWGAWLAYLFAVKYPEYVRKLILISSGPFDIKYLDHISQNRIKRFTENEKAEYFAVLNRLNSNKSQNKDEDLSRLGDLAEKADILEPLDTIPFSTPARELTKNPGEIYACVWPEAAKLRESGELLKMAERIKCPLIIIQGDTDSHPFEGVKKPLENYIINIKCYVLEQCGHYPWLEKKAHEQFYKLLQKQTAE